MALTDRKYRRAAQTRYRAKPSMHHGSLRSLERSESLESEQEKFGTRQEAGCIMGTDLVDVPSPLRARSGHLNFAQELLAACDPWAAQTGSSYREQLRATGLQALQRVRESGQSLKAAQKANAASMKHMQSGHLPASPALNEAARAALRMPHPPAPAQRPVPYVTMCTTPSPMPSPMASPLASPMASPMGSPLATSQVLSWHELNSGTGPAFWPPAPAAGIMDVPSTPQGQRPDLMAIAMPQAMTFPYNREHIAAQLRAAMPVSYED